MAQTPSTELAVAHAADEHAAASDEMAARHVSVARVRRPCPWPASSACSAPTRAGDIRSRIASGIGALQALVTHTAGEATRNASTVVLTATAMLLSTVRRADQIVVPDRGTVVESGTHETLLARDGAYARLVREAA